MLDNGFCHLIASDAHNSELRVPRMSDVCRAVARRQGDEEATKLFLVRPQDILNNASPAELPPALQAGLPQDGPQAGSASAWSGLLKRVRRIGGG